MKAMDVPWTQGDVAETWQGPWGGEATIDGDFSKENRGRMGDITLW